MDYNSGTESFTQNFQVQRQESNIRVAVRVRPILQDESSRGFASTKLTMSKDQNTMQ